MHLGVALNSCTENPSTADIGWGVFQSNSPYRPTSGAFATALPPALQPPLRRTNMRLTITRIHTIPVLGGDWRRSDDRMCVQSGE
jgi:hypothetical protein